MRVCRALGPLLALFVVWLGSASTARADAGAAQPVRAVVLDSDACAEIPAPELRELMALELSPRPLLAPGGAPQGTRASFARLVCSGTQAQLRVDDPERGESQQLELDLAETMASARTRLVALALSELIATLEMEGADAAPRASAAAAPASGVKVSVSSATALPEGHAWLGVGASRAGKPALWGVALSGGAVWYIAKLPLGVQLDLLGTRAEHGLSEGQVRAWTLAGSLALAAALRRPWLEASLALGLGLGYAWLQGTASSATEVGNQVHALWWGPVLQGGLLVPVHKRWGIRAALELGYVAKPVRGLDTMGQSAYALEGFPLLAALGVSLGF